MTSISVYTLQMEAFLSIDRFNRYVEWSNGNREQAIELYTLNTKLSECLYTPLHTLEVALRNRIHAVMSDKYGEDWFGNPSVRLTDTQYEQLNKVIAEIEGNNKKPTPGRIVAGLTFGFWTAMLGPDHETLWQQSLHRIGRRSDGKGLRRKDFSGPLAKIRALRNRVAHHEPILDWNLPKHHEAVLLLTEWLSPAAAQWCRAHSRFDEVHPQERIVLHRAPKGAEGEEPNDAG